MQILWILHSDLSSSAVTFIANNTELYTIIENILNSEFVPLSVLYAAIADPLNTSPNSLTLDNKQKWINRCWQYECHAWCFRLLLEEIKQSLSTFDTIGSDCLQRRENVHSLILELMEDNKILSKWKRILITVPSIDAYLTQMRMSVVNQLNIDLTHYKYDLKNDYGIECMDNSNNLCSDIKLFCQSIELTLHERHELPLVIPQFGSKRKHYACALPDMNENSGRYYCEIIQEYNLYVISLHSLYFLYI